MEWKSIWRWAGLWIVSVLGVCEIATGGTVLHVAPSGRADAAGTAAAPVDLNTALSRLTQTAEVTEVVLAGGDYFITQQSIFGPKDVPAEQLPVLTVRAAEGQAPRLVTANKVGEAQAVAEFPGLFRTPLAPGRGQLSMWEADTRTRYKSLATRGSVAVYDASCFHDEAEKVVYFRTSTGKPPAEHQVFIDQAMGTSLFVGRSKVVLDGLQFVGNHTATSVSVQQREVTVRRCRFENCVLAIDLAPAADAAVIEDCVGVDAAQGVYSLAKNTVMQRNRFEKKRDRLLLDLYPQNDSAYQVYHPGSGGRFVDNIARGYWAGIWIKADGGPYTVQHNTLVDCHYGIMWATGNRGSDASGNIIVNSHEFLSMEGCDNGFTCDRNVVWGAADAEGLQSRLRTLRGANQAQHTLVADPRFVDADGGDYRLLPDSPALLVRDADGRPAGALGEGTVADAQRVGPRLELAFASDSRTFGARGSYDFVGDPWNGTGTSHIRDLLGDGPPQRLATERTLTVHPRAFDPVGRITRLRVQVGEQEAQEVEYRSVYQVQLPEQDGTYRLRMQVANERGQWSAAAEAMLRADRLAPAVVGEPAVVTSDHGVLVSFRTNEPCTAVLRYGLAADKLDREVVTPKRITRFWDSNDGGEWVETWTEPRTQFDLAIARPAVTTGQTVHVQIEVTDDAGLRGTSKVFSATLAGRTRTLFVAPAGKSESSGTREQPLDSLQRAVERALPGDRIVVLPGTYPGTTLIQRGGADENTRLIIEAETPGTVTLDAAKRHHSVVHVEDAPYVTLRGLRLLYFNKAAVHAYRSPYTVMENVVSWNDVGWVVGYHFFAFWSPHCTVTRCLSIGSESGYYFQESPFATITHNTVCQQMYAATGFAFSEEGIVQKYNSFAFSGNSITSILARNPAAFKTIQMDYNNYGADVLGYEPNAAFKTKDPELWKRMEAAHFTTGYPPAKFRTISKHLMECQLGVFHTLADWQQASGLDTHSVFGDPLYVNPLPPIDQWDWRVRGTSVNVQKDVPGGVIGALGVRADP